MVRVQKRKIQWAISLFLVMLYFSGLPAQAQYGGGSGTADAPYLIYTAEQMNAIGANPNDWDKHFKLTADIDLSAYTGTDFNIIGYYVRYASPDNKPFTGVFDGSGHIISNFSYTSTDTDFIGLFGYVSGENALIKDLGLIDPNIDAGTGNRVGSLVGYMTQGTITGCYAEGGSVSGDRSVGGLVGSNGFSLWGYITSGMVSNSYSSGSVSGDSSVGGLVGDNGGRITNCYATGSVTGDNDVGGLVGYNYGTITNSYSAGSVSANEQVGGLVGSNGYVDPHWPLPGTISNCYSTSSVSGTTNVGGLVGYNGDIYEAEVSNSFWDIQTSDQMTSAGGKGETTAEMQMASTFIGWGCDPVWTIDEGKDYPRLWWENKTGELLDTKLSDFMTGAGMESAPYLIYTAEQLNVISVFPCELDKHFKLMSDIDLSAYTGTDFNVIGYYRSSQGRKPFTGVFDGNGYTISNFNYTSTDTDRIGLFGYVSGKNAVIRDLGLIDPNVDAGTANFVGSLVGCLGNGTITNCYATGSVSGTGWYVGGLVGWNGYYSEITNCYSSGDVAGDKYVGGLVGNSAGTITNCYSSASVPGNSRVGGLVGFNSDTITNCYATGSVLGTGSGVGGLVGGNGYYGEITNCYSVGSVIGNEDVGGLVGYNGYSGTITNCYSVGSVTGNSNVGGLVGYNGDIYEAEVSSSFWDIETSGQTTSAGGKGKTTAEMQTESTFTDAGWDFLAETANGTEDIWWILEGQDYPRLTWELVGN